MLRTAHHNKTISSWEIEMGKVPVPGLEMLGGLGCHSANVKPSVRLGIGRMSGRDVRSLEPCPHIHYAYLSHIHYAYLCMYNHVYKFTANFRKCKCSTGCEGRWRKEPVA